MGVGPLHGESLGKEGPKAAPLQSSGPLGPRAVLPARSCCTLPMASEHLLLHQEPGKKEVLANNLLFESKTWFSDTVFQTMGSYGLITGFVRVNYAFFRGSEVQNLVFETDPSFLRVLIYKAGIHPAGFVWRTGVGLETPFQQDIWTCSCRRKTKQHVPILSKVLSLHSSWTDLF